MPELKQLGDFVLEKKIGHGGMGEVYLAHQVSLDRRVAVKVLPRSLATQENFIERFQREAKAAANLIHPNVIQIYSIGVEQGTPYFAMEYVDGEDLAERLKRVKRLSYEEAVDIVAGVANALACAYEKNIVHRDIKPSNIMLDKNNVVKVMDFGLAKATQGGDQVNLTQSGLIMGTPNYMSPEQARGEPLDCRSDLYSLGVVFYELITGRLPFVADTPAALIYKHAYEEPEPPHVVNPDVPPFLEEIVTRLLAKDPNDRYQNPKALLLDLNEFRRNAEYYLRGGERRQPVVTGGRVEGGAGSAARQAPAAAGLSESTFKDADTLAETRHGEGEGGADISTQDMTRIGGGRGTPAWVWLLVLLALGAGGWLAWPRLRPAVQGSLAGGGGSSTQVEGAKGRLDLAALGKRLPAGVKVFVQQGADRKELPFADLDVPLGRYVLIFHRPGFRDVTRDVEVTPEGTRPPLSDMAFAFEPTAEMQRLFARAEAALEQRRYGKAVELLEAIDQTTPDFPGLAVLLAEARKRHAELESAFKQGQRLIAERRWKKAVEVLRKLPESYEKRFEALQLISTAEAKLTALENLRRSFEDQFAQGELEAARLTLEQLEALVPPGAAEIADAKERIAKAQKLYADAVGEYDNAQLREAKRLLEALLELCPRHAEARRMLAEVRGKLAAISGEAKRLAELLGAADRALAAGEPTQALVSAREAVRIAPDDAEAQAAYERARTAVARKEIGAQLAALDRFFVGRKAFNVLEMFDPRSKALRNEVERDLARFFAAPIVVERAEHSGLDVAVQGDDGAETVRVECVWRVVMRFPLAQRARPPVRGALTRLAVRQRFTFRRAGEGWLITALEQLGKANVE